MRSRLSVFAKCEAIAYRFSRNGELGQWTEGQGAWGRDQGTGIREQGTVKPRATGLTCCLPTGRNIPHTPAPPAGSQGYAGWGIAVCRSRDVAWRMVSATCDGWTGRDSCQGSGNGLLQGSNSALALGTMTFMVCPVSKSRIGSPGLERHLACNRGE